MKLATIKSFEVAMILLMSATLLTTIRSFNTISLNPIDDNIHRLKLQISSLITFIASCHYYLIIKAPHKIIAYRYLDWFFTTPLLLIDLCLTYRIFNSNIIGEILVYNTVMLGFGFLGEIGIINKWLACIAGFIPLIVLYYRIWQNMEHTENNNKLFWVFTVVWSMYGVIYLLDNEDARNLVYNILDIISKGGFASYLYFSSWHIQI